MHEAARLPASYIPHPPATRAHPASASIPALATCLSLAPSPRTCANHPQKREKAAGEAALFSDEWSEEKSLERFEEYPFNYSKSRIYLSSRRNRTHQAEAFRKSQNASALEAR